MSQRFQVCLLVSIAVHLGCAFSVLSAWPDRVAPTDFPAPPVLHLTWRASPSTAQGRSQPVLTPSPRRRRPRPASSPEVLRTNSAAPIQALPPQTSPSVDGPQDRAPESPAYPQHTRHKTAPAAPSDSPIALTGVSPGSLTEPVLLKGPLKIPLPDPLRQRAGSLRISLKCVVAADGTAVVSVEEGTGMVALDESLRSSFSNLNWYPAEKNGKPVAMAIRLVIETSWPAGTPAIDWGGRIPK